MRQKIGSQAEAKHWNVLFIDQRSKLVDLLGSKELAFVGNNNVQRLRLDFIQLVEVVFRSNNLGFLAESDAASDKFRPIPNVHTGLYQPDLHALFFIIELCYQRLC